MSIQIDAHGVAHREPVRVLEPEGGTAFWRRTLIPAMPLVTTGAYQL